MTDREIILGRIGEALKFKAAFPGSHDESCSVPGKPGGNGAGLNARQWLPFVPADDAGRWELFQRNATALKAALHKFTSQDDMLAFLVSLAREEGWKKIGAHSAALPDAACTRLSLPVVLTSRGYDPSELEACDAGISECDALVAQTGSVLVTSRSSGGRALSVLPPHHVVLARSSQLIPDLPAAFQLIEDKYGKDYPSMISLITGPSRTGDIERILVLGAHGPRKLTILCVD